MNWISLLENLTMLKVGIIGYGKMGRIRHEVIEGKEDVSVEMLFDPTPFDSIHNIANSADDIIHHPDIDVIFICTPNFLNKKYTIQSLEAGKHVFCEKPPAFTASDVTEIQKVEQKSGKLLMYGFNHRHHESIRHMKELFDSNEFGKILWMRGRYGKSVDHTYYDNWRSKKELAGGGILIDQGIHMLDLFLYFGQEFDRIHACVSNLFWNLDVEDNVFATLENTKSGLSASLHSTMTQWRHLFSLEVFLEKGYFVLNGLKTSSNTYGDETLSIAKNRSTAPAATWEDEEHITYHNDHSWEIEMDEYFAAIKESRNVVSGSSNDALKLMKVVDTIYSFAK
jgi:1,5-anhydro-D-fructose reductase (1,5-anhydro-D-mannitol-forming)